LSGDSRKKYMENVENEKKQSLFVSIFAKFNIFKSMAGRDIIDEAIKKIIYALVILIPIWFLPITSNAVEFNKQVLMVLLIIVALILWFVKILNRGEIRWRSNILNIVLGAFALIFILSTVFSIRPYGSLVGWATHLKGSLINVLCFIALYFLIVNNFKGIKEAFGLLFSFLVSAAIVTVIGFLQIWSGFILPWGITKSVSFNTLGSVNSLGIFSAVVMTLITAILFVIKNKGIKLFLLLLGLLSLIIIININFWVVWVVLAIGMAIILMLGLMQMVQLGEKISWIALPIALLAISLIFLFFKPVLPLKPNLPMEVGLSYKGGWSVVSNTLKEKPILGSGPETFVFDYAKYKPVGINQTAFWNIRFSNAPAEIYSLATDLGILGLIGFLAVIVLFIVKAVLGLIKEKEDNDILKRFLGVGIFAGWLGLTVSWFLYPQNFVLMFLFWLLFAIYLIEGSSQKEGTYNLRKSPKVLLTASFSFIVVIVVVIGFLYIIGTRFVAEATYKRGVDIIQTKGDIDTGLNKIIKSTVINPYEDNTYQVLAQLFTLKLQQDAAKTNLPQEERFNLIQADAVNAINSATQTTVLSPKDAVNWALRGQIYRGLLNVINGASEWAETSYNEAIKLEPSNPFIYLELGRLYTNRADLIVEQAKKNTEDKKKWDEYLDVALKNFNKAIELKPNYAPAHFEVAQVFNRQGKLTEAIKKMEINFQLTPNDSGTVFQLGVLYYRDEQYDKAKAAFIRAITIDDNYSNARYFLGMIYDKENNKKDAINQFERIATLNPDNEQIKQILTNLKSGLPALGSPTLGPPTQPSNVPIEEQPKGQ